MYAVLVALAGLLLTVPSATQDQPATARAEHPGQVPEGACEIQPDLPYVSPRLPLGRAAYAHRPACRTVWAAGPDEGGLYVQGPPIRVEGQPVNVGGLKIYLLAPEIIVAPSPVTIEPPQVQSVPVPAEDSVPPSAD